MTDRQIADDYLAANPSMQLVVINGVTYFRKF